ncbi:Hint domain-containing protein [Aliiroseovarius sp. KMU-50]|uniref:Hint domain-containing protein n=1 Tax=Aliiroseovarius salicola TaxID=3009082 RepID=A0ABT4W0Q7_9RHOB|nr:Hint domain-containing protein [Aliiroseovarius sp. KMU-50]MDA5094103.1 Hint domain-containing protein [Aliiroseovarius sp. KMU-50]
MSNPQNSKNNPDAILTLPVHPAETFSVVQGVNEGDPLTDASELVLEDAYALTRSEAHPLSLRISEATGPLEIANGTRVGTVGAPVFLDCVLTLMPPHGDTFEAIVLVETTPDHTRIVDIHFYPLAPLTEGIPYTLVTIDTDNARARLAESASVSFTRGTRITMADGRQVPIEELTTGDRILTRDSGPQPLRWIGQQTVRANGAFAPITIAAGALNNEAELTLSPSHRLFIYQRVDALNVGQKEVLLRAGDLVNGEDVTQSEGGFVDYFQLLFDKHEIIYAEGIPAESQFVDQINRPALPDSTPSHDKGTYAREVGKDRLGRSSSTRTLRALKGGSSR